MPERARYPFFSDNIQFWHETKRSFGASSYGASEFGDVIATVDRITSGDNDRGYKEWNIILMQNKNIDFVSANDSVPGLEKRLARHPQFYCRIGFVHEFRSLSASEIRELLERHWTPPSVKLPGDAIDSIAAASIIRITGGNFRRLNRLLTQVEPILEINALPSVTKEAIDAARENLVIGQS